MMISTMGHNIMTRVENGKRETRYSVLAMEKRFEFFIEMDPVGWCALTVN